MGKGTTVFPTVDQLRAQTKPRAICVCGQPITTWRYRRQGEGSAGHALWWVHVDTARRSHTRDTTSPYCHPSPFAHPAEN